MQQYMKYILTIMCVITSLLSYADTGYDTNPENYDWYVVNIRTNKYMRVHAGDDGTIYADSQTPAEITSEYLWSFVRNDDGTYTIINMAYGVDYAMCSTTNLNEGGAIKMRSRANAQHFDRVSTTNGYYFKPVGRTSNVHINDHHCNGVLFYNLSTDNGSVLRLQSANNYQRILRQPSINDMSVEVTNPGRAEYQWYFRSPEGLETYDNWTSTNAGQDGTTSSKTYTVEGQQGKELSFDWSVSSESGYDYLTIKVNGEQRIRESGTSSGTFTYTFDSNSTLSIEVSYSKDGSVSQGQDTAQISNFIVSAPAEPINGATGKSFDMNLVADNGEYYCVVNYPQYNITLTTIKISLTPLPNDLYVDPCVHYHNKTGFISVCLRNNTDIVGFQFDLALPAGFEFVLDEQGNPNVKRNDERTNPEAVDLFRASILNSGVLRVLYASTSDAALLGNDGEVVRIEVANTCEHGTYQANILNVVLTGIGGTNSIHKEEILASISVEQLKGDSNDDGEINIADFESIASYIMGEEVENFNFYGSDINSDGIINVSDLNAIISILLSQTTSNEEDEDEEQTDNVIYIEEISATPGEILPLSVCMRNNFDVSGFQFDIELPDGFEFVQSQALLSSARTTPTATDLFRVANLNDLKMRVLCGSTLGCNFTGIDGEIATIYIKVSNTVANGNYQIKFKNIVLTDNTGTQCTSAINQSYGLTIDDSGTAGVGLIDADESQDIYDVYGRRLKNPVQGINIVNGQKILY